MEYLVGFLVAIVITITGVGAGVLTVPLLFYVMHLPLAAAVSTALAYSAAVKLVVVPIQMIRRQIEYRVLSWMLLGGLPGVVIGSLLFNAASTHGPNATLTIALGLIIALMSTWNLVSELGATVIPRPVRNRSRWLSLIMCPIGAEIGFSSSGAGALGTLGLFGFTNLATTQVVGTNLAFGLLVALVGSGVHLLGGNYPGAVLTKMVVGGVAGAVVGAVLAPRIPNRYLRIALSAWLIVIGCKMFWDGLALSG